MRSFRLLVIDDDESWTRTLCDNLKTLSPGVLAGPGFQDWEIEHFTNQEEATARVTSPAAPQYDLVLLDLNYPSVPKGPIRLKDEAEDLQGMTWLPELRRLQPKAAIVICTSYVQERNMLPFVNAIRSHLANDYVPKTAFFQEIVGRISVAVQNAMQRERMLDFDKEWRQLVRNGAAKVYSLDVTILLTDLGHALRKTAQQIESGNPSAIMAAPDSLRAGPRAAMARLNKLTEMLEKRLTPTTRPKETIEITQLAHDLLLRYEGWIGDVQAKSIGPDSSLRLSVITFGADLKMAIHEVMANAVESLAVSQRPANERQLSISVQEREGNAVMIIEDNGDGFSSMALSNLFTVGFTTRDPLQHPGLGLHVARRMMHAVGGDIKIENIPTGGARVGLIVPDLK